MKRKRRQKGGTVWDMAVDAVANHGERFRVDIIGRSFQLGGVDIIKDGVCSIPLGIETDIGVGDVLRQTERLYDDFYVSVPTRNTHRSIFGRLRDKLSRSDMMFAERTDIAQLKLELFVLLSVLAGTLKWDEEVLGRGYCWQSSRNKHLVIMKKWIDNGSCKSIG